MSSAAGSNPVARSNRVRLGMRAIILMLLLTGCSKPAPVVPRSSIAFTTPAFCFDLVVDQDGKPTPARGCVPTYRLCNMAVRTAIAISTIAKIHKVTPCYYAGK